MADDVTISTETGFDGFPPSFFYLDAANATLTEDLPAGSAMAASTQVAVSIWPRFLNAPGQALGSNNTTQFKARGKPNAYLKVQLSQDQPGASNTKPQTWASMYPLVDNPNDDIGNTYFDDPVSGDPVENVPLPGATGQLRLALAAVVGGPSPHSLLSILKSVISLAGGTAGKAVFPIPAADTILATNVENLLNLASNAFGAKTQMQYWISQAPQPLAVSSTGSVPDDALKLPSGTSFLVAVPTGDNEQIVQAVRDIVAQKYAISIDRGGQLIANNGGKIVDPNPFDPLIYVTLRVTVTAH